MTLDRCAAGKNYTIREMDLKRETQIRLEALGMTRNTEIHVSANKNNGTMIIKVRGTRFAIGKGISSKINVKIQ